MKTAVEELFEEMNRIRLEDESGNIGALDFFNQQNKAFDKAKAIERKQMIDLVKYIFKEVDFNEPHVPYEIVDLYLIADDRKQKSVGKNI